MDNAQFQQFLNTVRGRGAGMTLQPFTSGDSVEWRDWRSHYETIAEYCGWDDIQQRRQLKAAMQKEAASRVRDLGVNDHPNIAAMLAAFENRFVPQAEAMIVKAEFETARQEAAEKLMDWHSRLRAIFIRAYPQRDAATDDQLIRAFISGITDPAIKMFVLEGAPDTYVQALTRAQNKEAMLLTVKQMGLPTNGGRRGGINNIASFSEEINAFGQNNGQQNGNRKGACFFCRRPGHFVKDCIVLKRAEAFLKRMKEAKDKKKNGQGKKNGSQPTPTTATVNAMNGDLDDNTAFQKALEELPESFFTEVPN